MKKVKFLLGNEAIALGAIEAGIRFAVSYPGTPASEIQKAFMEFSEKLRINSFAKWMVNEKVAFESALGASWCNMDAMVSMKQVGLNVACDPLMSSAYTGTKGALVIVSADDPGPHSSQTEQDSRFLAMFAKIPVFDPSSPQDAKRLMIEAVKLSKNHKIPVMLRPVLRVSHSRGTVEIGEVKEEDREITFNKEPERFAATPKYRYLLHKELNAKIREIGIINARNLIELLKELNSEEPLYITSGIFYAIAKDLGIKNVLKVDMPYPIDRSFFDYVLENFKEIWVLEETYPVIEIQFSARSKVKGRLSGHIPLEGEIDINLLNDIIFGKKKKVEIKEEEKKPRLCPGCGHRPVFYLMRKIFPKGIYPGDIGCYTLGVNLNAVDTCLCMGASISQAIGISKAINKEKIKTPVLCTIGDSTFIHAGIPALIEAANSKAPIIVIILNNKTTAMTGGQPVHDVNFESLAIACGIKKVEKAYAYDIEDISAKLKLLWEYTGSSSMPSVLIVNSPCVTYQKAERVKRRSAPRVMEEVCSNCGICYKIFECPAIIERKNKAVILDELCRGCRVCIEICPTRAIRD
ncbi:MAG: thiamine pyrophosphate-dependent enzyme [Thermosulfidibacteraceae bacterium]|jgi:indolepyruvate ferredoxin oxidoreductase alpha subunit